MPKRPPVASTSPGTSNLRLAPRLSVSRSTASGPTTSPTGTLIQKIQCQERPLITTPPMTGPRATPRPLMPDQMPSASPRRPAGNASERRVRVSGITTAAPAPWKARATISAPALGASAAAAEPTVKMPSPMTNIRRLPKRSPSAAPESIRTAKARV